MAAVVAEAASGFPYDFPYPFGVSVAATPTAEASTTLLYVQSVTTVTATLSAEASTALLSVQASTVITASPDAEATKVFYAEAVTTITATPTASSSETIVLIKAASPGFPHEFPYHYGVVIEATATAEAIAGKLYDIEVGGPTVPYVLPYQFGTQNILATSLVRTGYEYFIEAAGPGFPYDFPIPFGVNFVVATATAEAITGLAIEASQTIDAGFGVDVSKGALAQALALITALREAAGGKEQYLAGDLAITADLTDTVAGRAYEIGVAEVPPFPLQFPYRYGTTNIYAFSEPDLIYGAVIMTETTISVTSDLEFGWDLTTTSSLPITTIFDAHGSRAYEAQTYTYGLPLPLPFRFGTWAQANLTGTIQRGASGESELSITADTDADGQRDLLAAGVLAATVGLPLAIRKDALTSAALLLTANIQNQIGLGYLATALLPVTSTQDALGVRGRDVSTNLEVTADLTGKLRAFFQGAGDLEVTVFIPESTTSGYGFFLTVSTHPTATMHHLAPVASDTDITVVDDTTVHRYTTTDTDLGVTAGLSGQVLRKVFTEADLEVLSSVDGMVRWAATMMSQLGITVTPTSAGRLAGLFSAALEALVSPEGEVLRETYGNALIMEVTADGSGEGQRGRFVESDLPVTVDFDDPAVARIHIGGSFLTFFWASSHRPVTVE